MAFRLLLLLLPLLFQLQRVGFQLEGVQVRQIEGFRAWPWGQVR
jgi:hypothetical protein